MRKALLLSGGLDSAAICFGGDFDVGYVIDYGQLPAEAEVRAAQIIAKQCGLPLEVLRVDCKSIGYGSLVAKASAQLASKLRVREEWWPYRNQLLVTLAASRAVIDGVRSIAIGTVKTDGEHKDGRPEFVEALNRLLSCQEGQISLEAPAISLTSKELFAATRVPTTLLGWAHSCHKSNRPCGSCRGCAKYAQLMPDQVAR